MAAEPHPRPLDGLKVLDFCWVAVGPMITKYLAEYGATVIRVESSKRPDTLRSGAPLKDDIPGINRSGYFANYNANKLGAAIDMRHPKAKDLILKLASWADLLTENFTPGTMESWGMGFDDLKKLNPKLVMFSTSMLGRGGPMEKQPGFGAVLSSLAGLTFITGWPDRDPVNPLRGLHRLHRPQVCRRIHPGRPGLLPAHRGRDAPGHVTAGGVPALHCAVHAGPGSKQPGADPHGQP